MKGINYFKEISDAVTQSCQHYKSTKVASAQALAAERAFQEKEQERLERERKKAENKARRQEELEMERKKRKNEKAEDKKKKKEDKAKEAEVQALQDEDDKEAEAPRVRRGKGLNEFTDMDAPLIRDKIPGCECKIVAVVDDFLKHMCYGDPVILRLSRSTVKKVMEFHAEMTGANKTEINAVNNSFKTELAGFISDFAEKVEDRGTERERERESWKWGN